MGATLADTSALRSDNRRFYLWMAAAFVLIAFGGFTPSYWSKVATGAYHGAPIFHIHGILLFTWTCFYFLQTALVAAGRTPSHRNWGLAGISLFSVLMCSILVGEVTVLRRDETAGMGEAARHFSAVTLCAWPLLVGIFTLAIVNIRRPETHKRLMLLLMVALMTPALARVFIALFSPPGAIGPPPPVVSIAPSLLADLLLVVAMIRDWRIHGRPHPVYVYGGLALLAEQVMAVPIAATAAWMSFAGAFEKLAG